MDSSKLRTGELVAGIGGVALFVFLFFDWFGGGAGGDRQRGRRHGDPDRSPGVSGWDALTDLPGFLIILSGVAGIALACSGDRRAAGEHPGTPGRRHRGLGTLAILLILWRMFAGSPTLKIGIFLGLAAAIAITAGALMALRRTGSSRWSRLPGAAQAQRRHAPTATQPAAPPVGAPDAGSTRSSGGSAAAGTPTKKAAAKKTARRSAPPRSRRLARRAPASARRADAGRTHRPPPAPGIYSVRCRGWPVLARRQS